MTPSLLLVETLPPSLTIIKIVVLRLNTTIVRHVLDFLVGMKIIPMQISGQAQVGIDSFIMQLILQKYFLELMLL